MDSAFGVYILLAGALIVLAMIVRTGLERIGIPPLVGYFAQVVLVSAVTAIGVPLVLGPLLDRFPSHAGARGPTGSILTAVPGDHVPCEP